MYYSKPTRSISFKPTPLRNADWPVRVIHMRTVMQPATSGLGDRIIKVDHAGEHGAICIYTGQILMARLTAPTMLPELAGFRSHELRKL